MKKKIETQAARYEVINEMKEEFANILEDKIIKEGKLVQSKEVVKY